MLRRILPLLPAAALFGGSLLAQHPDPLRGQLPKSDLGVAALQARQPEYDGRGVRVAVLDTGIDPGHPFLQRASTGGRKIVDWYDATTDGRIDLVAVVGHEGGRITGLSGRALQLGRWAAPGREFRLGRIDSQFLPGGLAARLRSGRRSVWEDGRRRWQERQAAAVGAATDPAQAALWEHHEDPGPVWDLVVFEEQPGAWRLLIDNDEDGDLDEEPALRSFRESGDWAPLGDEALLHYAVSVAEDGASLRLFFDANGHGTHVAGIIGAWGGAGSRLNGLAPGVEFVAIKIGDGKYGGSTTGFSIGKALDYAVEAGCQVVNMSFGGPSFAADGLEPDAWAIDQAVARGLVVVTSAGNEGPALTTIGAPATADGAVAVAAAIWPDTQRVNYGSLQPAGPVLFDFSSRGPLPGGGLGIAFAAPGAALSSLPAWLLTAAENFNGTSMASPQVAGCFAVLRGAAEAEGLGPAALTPRALTQALRETAQPLPGYLPVEQGAGVPRVPEALAALRRIAAAGPAAPALRVRVENAFGSGAGIYERDAARAGVFERAVHIEPVFAAGTSNAEKAAYLHSFRAVSDAAWVSAPAAVYSSAAGRNFVLRVDPRGLPPGLHVAQVSLHDADSPNAGAPAAIVPVTLIVPIEASAASTRTFSRTLGLAPGQLERTFLQVPFGAQYARLRFRQRGEGSNEFRSGAGSVSGLRHWERRQLRGRFVLEDGGVEEQLLPVEAGTVLEVAVVSRWATNRAARLELEVEFLGLEARHAEAVVPAGQDVLYLAAKSPMRAESAQVEAKIEGVAYPVLAPWTVVPDPIRSSVFDGHGLFHAVCEWPVLVEAGDGAVGLHMPRSIPSTELREDLMLEIFDPNGRVVQRQVVAERDTGLGKLEPGAYRFRLTFAGPGREPFEVRYAGAQVRVAKEARSLAVYSSFADMFHAGAAAAGVEVPMGGVRQLFARLPELPALDAGAFHYGAVRWTRAGTLLLEQPLRVERPVVDQGAPPAGLVSGASPAGSERAAWREALTAGADGAAVLTAARAWAHADPLDPAAEVAVLEAMATAGQLGSARLRASGFLTRFPAESDRLFEFARRWNK